MTTHIVTKNQSQHNFDGKFATLMQDVSKYLPRSHAVKDDIAKVTRVIHSIATFLYDRGQSPYSREDIDIMIDYLAMKLKSWKDAL